MRHSLAIIPYLLVTILLLNACATEQSPVNEQAPVESTPMLQQESSVEVTTPATDLVIVAPWTADGLKPEFVVSEERSGTCFAGALTAGRVDAWRCSVDQMDDALGDYSQLLDPCLENPFDPDGPLACLLPDDRVILLSLTEPLPREFANPADQETLPISLVLDNGDECNLATGATITVPIDGEQQRVNYLCRSGSVLIGQPDTSGTIWTINYSADPRGEGEILTMGIAKALAFRGDTANIGWPGTPEAPGPLQDVRLETLPGGQRLVFDFGDGGLPGYEIGYVRERVRDEQGDELQVQGDQRLRVWFHYPAGTPADYKGEVRRITPDEGSFINDAVLARLQNGDLFWYLGLDNMSGFHVTRDPEASQIILDIYQPEPRLADRPDLGVGDEGLAVRILQEKLIAAGYLDELPADPLYDEPTRRAVVALQSATGLIPDGVAGPAVWAALERPLPPPRNGTSSRYLEKGRLSLIAFQETAYVTPIGLTEVYVRSGPGMDYPTIGSLLPGDTAEIIGQQVGSDPTTSWWEVCCVTEQSGWVRWDVVNVIGDTANIAEAEAPESPSPQGIRPSDLPSQSSGQSVLYFTFDDGPWAEYTETVAELMEQNGGRATFFEIGGQVDWTPEISAAVATNHSVQNHTYNHASLDTLGHEAFFNEVERTQVAIQGATSVLPTCLRPPYGATDETTYQMAAELGLDVVLWTVDTQDWRMPGVDAIVNHILQNASPGAIFLMHDGGGDRSQTIEALEIVLPQLRQQGYTFEALCG